MNSFDVIVVGAGHAGVEAAMAAARVGTKVLMVTTNLDRIAFMSCNPAIGGLGKGHIVREIDVLGGEMGVATDKSCIQFKRLNSTKGPAVRGSRAQCDKDIYSQTMTSTLANYQNVTIMKGEAKALLLEKEVCKGVELQDGTRVHSTCVILTTGTFMNGVMHVGGKTESGGRVGDNATIGLSDQMKSLGFTVHRLKTGTPPRLASESIDWSKTKPEGGDKRFFPFSFKSPKAPKLKQVNCFLAYTNEKTHEIINKNLHRSPIYGGEIEGIGPRYCPSIEDKVVRFSDRDRHQTFLEPEGLSTNSIYLQGISTSLPEDVQMEFLKTIPGLENVDVLRFGYAIEYDFFEPTQIKSTLETWGIENLYLAGQINGTSGYEEAAGQGLVAGANAALKIKGEGPMILGREESYIGVMIDDLITKGTREPYRMFTSRAEFRLNLREDNAIERLLSKSYSSRLLDSEYYDQLQNLLERRNQQLIELSKTVITPKPLVQEKLKAMGTTVLTKPCSLKELLRRSEISFNDLGQLGHRVKEPEEVSEAVEIAVKYEGYIRRQQELINSMTKMEGVVISDLNFSQVAGLSREEMEKLEKVRPRTLGQASRISGVNPSGIQALLVHKKSLERRSNEQPSC